VGWKLGRLSLEAEAWILSQALLTLTQHLHLRTREPAVCGLRAGSEAGKAGRHETRLHLVLREWRAMASLHCHGGCENHKQLGMSVQSRLLSKTTTRL
jgi:hypothetical protein